MTQKELTITEREISAVKTDFNLWKKTLKLKTRTKTADFLKHFFLDNRWAFRKMPDTQFFYDEGEKLMKDIVEIYDDEIMEAYYETSDIYQRVKTQHNDTVDEREEFRLEEQKFEHEKKLREDEKNYKEAKIDELIRINNKKWEKIEEIIEKNTELRVENAKKESKNNVLQSQITAQTISIKGYKEQITELMTKLADITEKSVTKVDNGAINEITVNND